MKSHYLPHFSPDLVSLVTLVSTETEQKPGSTPGLRCYHIRWTPFMCLLISNAPSLDDIADVTALIVHLSVITHVDLSLLQGAIEQEDSSA